MTGVLTNNGIAPLEIWDDRAVVAAEAAEKEARDAYRAAQAASRAARRAYWKDRFKVEPGVRVKDRDGRYTEKKDRVGTVTEVDDRSWSLTSPPWVMVNLDKKDGTPGTRNVRFYNWEVIE